MVGTSDESLSVICVGGRTASCDFVWLCLLVGHFVRVGVGDAVVAAVESVVGNVGAEDAGLDAENN